MQLAAIIFHGSNFEHKLVNVHLETRFGILFILLSLWHVMLW